MKMEDSLLIEKFLNDQLSPLEKENVLKRIEQDPSFRAQVRFEQELMDSLDPRGWNFLDPNEDPTITLFEEAFKSEKTQDLKRTLEEVSYNYSNQSTSKRSTRWILYSSAAMIAVIVGLFAWFNTNESPQDLYASYFDPTDLTSVAVRGDSTEDLLIQAEIAFEDKDYKKTLSIIDEQLKDLQNSKSAVYLYKGISHMELNEFNAAEDTFNTLIDSNLMDAEKGLWFEALLFLKMNDTKAAKKVLQEIVDNNYYNYSKASEVLKKLS